MPAHRRPASADPDELVAWVAELEQQGHVIWPVMLWGDQWVAYTTPRRNTVETRPAMTRERRA